MKASIVSAVAALAGVASANQFQRMGRLVMPVEEADEWPVTMEDTTTNVTGSAFFTQILDHDDPSKGTFQQKFWWNAENWKGPGSPVGWDLNSGNQMLRSNRSCSLHPERLLLPRTGDISPT